MHGYVSALLADKGRQVYTVAPTATVREAVREMNEKGVGALLVLVEDCPVGIFTERDVLRRVVDEGRNPKTTTVADVMTADVLVVEPSTPVEQVMATMTQRRIRHLPVVDEGRVVGLVSIGDVTRWMSQNQEAHIQRMTDYITGRAPA
ncbi:MAG TPA: CBS domain-containing protein [Tepidiformaceae bacterium]|nr:CBS domain-containing protein [Tepidiformaceae bacterium]